MPNFTWHSPTKIIFGAGSITSLSEEINRHEVGKVLILTDQGVKKAGLADKVKNYLDEKVEISIYANVMPEPSIESIEQCADYVRKNNYDLLIGLGGGSSIDVTKLASILALNNEPLKNLCGVNMISNPGLPFILVPTTAGTGSEVTPIAIVSDTSEKMKKGVVSPFLYAQAAICDPTLTIGLPPTITAFTGMDALTHAVEAFISVNASPITDALALKAVQNISSFLRPAFANGENLEAREGMMLGSLLAGMAFASAGVGAVHALAYPLGAHYNVAHGLANALLLPYVLEANMIAVIDRLSTLADIMGVKSRYLSSKTMARLTIEHIRDMAVDIEIPGRLRDIGVLEESLPEFARSAINVSRLLANNPRKFSEKEILSIYEKAF